MKRIPIVNKYHVNQYEYYLDDIERPFITVSHFTTSDHDTEIEDFKIFFDHIEFARPTVFMEYCYNQNFPIYLRKLCDLAVLAKKRWRDGSMMAAIDIMTMILVVLNIMTKVCIILVIWDLWYLQ